jgi:predicted RNA binding protein with dsRBD fold (UPF0201 family)
MTNRFLLNVALPTNNVEEFLEAIRCIGGIEHVTVTVDAENKRDAVRDLEETFEEFGATYQGTWYIGLKEAVQKTLRRQTARDTARKVLKLHRASASYE